VVDVIRCVHGANMVFVPNNVKSVTFNRDKNKSALLVLGSDYVTGSKRTKKKLQERERDKEHVRKVKKKTSVWRWVC
jgi:hypothetical protein